MASEKSKYLVELYTRLAATTGYARPDQAEAYPGLREDAG